MGRPLLLLLLLLGITPLLAHLDPFSNFKSKEEAQEGFRQIELALAQHKGGLRIRGLYQEWKRRYGLSFPAAEDVRRYAAFEANVRRIMRSNRSARSAHVEGLSRHTATFSEEWRARLLAPEAIPKEPPRVVRHKAVNINDLPKRVDWRTKGGVTPVRDQGNCGSCWAFSGIAAIESRLKQQTGKEYDLSEAHIVDCQTEAYACNGGWLDHAMKIGASASTPLVSEASYPYPASYLTCARNSQSSTRCEQPTPPFAPYCPNANCRKCKYAEKAAGANLKVKLKDSGMVYVAPGKAALMESVALYGPTAIAYNVVEGFAGYKSGVYMKAPGACGAANNSVNHGVLVVGYDAEADPPYWIIKNSWGEDFGMAGYFHMHMRDDPAGTCQMYWFGGVRSTDAEITEPGSQPANPSPPQPIPEPNYPLRMMLGRYTSTVNGRLEVFRADPNVKPLKSYYGTVCSDIFDHNAATVACRQMKWGKVAGTTDTYVGYAALPSVFGGASATDPNIKLWLDDVSCTGAEKRLQDCPHSAWGVTSCDHSKDVGISCGYYTVQLVRRTSQPNPNIYRVEAYINSKYGTICRDGITDNVAGVICRSVPSLGYIDGRVVALTASSKPPIGAASQPIWLGGITCNGKELGLQTCRHPLIGDHACAADHTRDLGIECTKGVGKGSTAAKQSPAIKVVVKMM